MNQPEKRKMSTYENLTALIQAVLNVIFYKDVLDIILCYVNILEPYTRINHSEVIREIFCDEKYFVIYDGVNISVFDSYSSKLLSRFSRVPFVSKSALTILGICKEDLLLWNLKTSSMSKISLLSKESIDLTADVWFPQTVFNCHHGWCVRKMIHTFEIQRTEGINSFLVSTICEVSENFQELHVVNQDLFGIFPVDKDSAKDKKLWRIPIQSISLEYYMNNMQKVTKSLDAYAEKFSLPNFVNNMKLLWHIKAVLNRRLVPGTTEKGELFMFNMETQKLYFTNYTNSFTKEFFASNGDHFFVINGSSIEISS